MTSGSMHVASHADPHLLSSLYPIDQTPFHRVCISLLAWGRSPVFHARSHAGLSSEESAGQVLVYPRVS